MAGKGRGAVFQAVIGNGILTVIKLAAFLVSGSGAMMSEAVHSFADTSNQGLLYIGKLRSNRPADERFQYGYGADRYVFALLSAMGIFVLGCGVTVYHGIHSLMNPPDLDISWIVFAVLGVSLLVDGYVLGVAVREVNAERGDKGFMAFIRSSTDPTLLAVLFEDFVASIGVIIAAVGIALAQVTGNPVFDAMSSIAIGVMLGILAIWLGWRNRELILGPAIDSEKSAAVISYLEQQPSIASVREVRTRIVGADRFRLAVDVDYEGRELGRVHAEWLRERAAGAADDSWPEIAAEFGDRMMESLGDEVDRIESELVERFPKIRDIDIEAD